jgi:hypothetical protein
MTIKRDIPLIIAFVTGMVMIADWHFDISFAHETVAFLRNANITVASFILGLGAINLFRRFGRRLMTNVRRKEYGIDIVLNVWMITILVLFTVASFWGRDSVLWKWLYDNVYFPPRLAHPAIWYLAPACYRFMRAKSPESVLITIAGFVGLMASSPVWMVTTPWAIEFNSWIGKAITGTVYRGAWIGVGLGSIGVGVRTLLGIESGYLGKIEEVAE